MKYITSAYSDRFKHPILAGVLSFAIFFFALAIALELTAPFTIPFTGREVPPFAAGFFGVFGTLTATMGLLAYAALFAAKFVSILRDRAGPAAS